MNLDIELFELEMNLRLKPLCSFHCQCFSANLFTLHAYAQILQYICGII